MSKPLVLVLRALGLGDLLTAVPAIRAIARAFPDHRRVLAAPRYLQPIVSLCGGMDETIDAAPLEPLSLNERPAVAVNLHGRGPQSHRLLLERAPHRLIAFENAQIEQTRGMPQWRADEHEVHRWCRMLQESGIPADPRDLGLPRPPPDARAQGAILIHAGAASESRRWPVENWIALCATLKSQGQRIVLTGSRSEFRRCRLIARAAHISISDVLAGRTGLRELSALVASAQAVICGDTGIAHLAGAFDVPSVVLFGPTSPKHWGPPVRGVHRIIWHGKLGDPHARYVDPGLASITVSEVLAELYVLMQMAHAV
ncbi:MAG: glycosyltransferase family 9 protein [Candidatus Baltobacteraceae bacterium]